MNFVEFMNKKLALETILAHAGIAATVFYVLFLRKTYPAIGAWLAKYGLWLAFLMAVGATGASLFYSNIAGFPPCDLCWYQRIFMYPLVILFGIALWKRDRAIADYGLVLAAIGFAISLYHNVMYYNLGGLNALCDIGGVGVSCVKRYMIQFGYITIPLMSLTAFTLIIIFLLFYKYSSRFSSQQQ